MIDVPAVVRNKARAAGAEDWLERLPALVSSLEADWAITVGHPYEGGTEAFVADATLADGTHSSAETDARCSIGTTPTTAPCSWSGWAGPCMSLDCRSPVAWRFFALPLSAYGGR